MSDFKEFTGKDVDNAIEAACSHYALSREDLEIEILSGGSAGIFGLMGKKAKVRARRRTRRQPFADLQQDLNLSLGDDILGSKAKREEPAKAEAPKAEPRRTEPKPAPVKAESPKPAPKVEPKAQPAQAKADAPAPKDEAREAAETEAPAAEPRREARSESRPAAPRRDGRPAKPRAERPELKRREPEADFDEDMDFDEDDAAPRGPAPDPKALEEAVREVLTRLLEPIIGQTTLSFSYESGRLKVLIDDEPNSGLIIGREGQTITALQYITNRIVARRFQTSVRVHLDAGDYRDKQDDNLRKLALYLADKAKSQGRTQSTKPLSSYHRRLVHLALQDDETISTRSKGDGPLKRVLIYPAGGNRRSGGRQQRGA